LQHEICALASFWHASANLFNNETALQWEAVDDLWQPNNNVR
jgi:hypothetical protein